MSKKIAKTLGVLLLSLTTSCISIQFKEQDMINFFKNFPAKIPGAKKIEIYYTPESKFCLVHIRQKHYIFGMKNKPKEINQIEKIQKNIYDILTFFIEKKQIREIRLEGFVDNGNTKGYKKRVEEIYKEIKEKTGKEYVGGAVKKLILENKINAKPAEKEKTRDKIDSLKEEMRYMEPIYIEYITEKRENDLIELIVNDSENISFTVYGGGHAWGGKKSCGKNYNLENKISNKDNIFNWNKKNPNKKFSLIEITPKEYKCY